MMTGPALANLLSWSVQVAIVTGAAALLPRLFRVQDPSVRYAFWRLVLAACLLLPLVQPWRAAGFEAADASGVVVSVPTTPVRGPGTPLGQRALLAPVSAWIPTAISLVVAVGALMRLAWLGAGLLRLRRLRTESAHYAPGGDPEAAELLQSTADVRYVRALRQPVTFGVFRPVVLLPECLDTLAPGVRRAVIVHELWHVRRRDWAWMIVEEVLRALLWFHPAISWLISRVQSAREEVVDELTVLTTNARRHYLEALLAFADEPTVFPAAPFARRRHLFHRMLLISREAAMSSRRVAAACAAMASVVALSGWYGVDAFPLTRPAAAPAFAAAGQMPPRDLRPGEPRPASSRETQLRAALSAAPGTPSQYIELAKMQEERGAVTEAEATLSEARTAYPGEQSLLPALAALYNRAGQFDKTMAVLEEYESFDPGDAARAQVVATYYWEKAFKDKRLSPVETATYIRSGINATDRALAIKPDYAEAMVYKNIFLRMQANLESDAGRKAALVAEADALRNKAMALQQAQRPAEPSRSSGMTGAPPPPPPPPPPPGPAPSVDGQQALRVGGNIKVPVKIKDVHPIYPPEAKEAMVQGVVIIEATIDAAGAVRETRVLRSVPMLDEAAREAVGQWQFTPTLMNGVPVPVIMTVTVNFTLQ